MVRPHFRQGLGKVSLPRSLKAPWRSRRPRPPQYLVVRLRRARRRLALARVHVMQEEMVFAGRKKRLTEFRRNCVRPPRRFRPCATFETATLGADWTSAPPWSASTIVEHRADASGPHASYSQHCVLKVRIKKVMGIGERLRPTAKPNTSSRGKLRDKRNVLAVKRVTKS